MLKVSPTLRFSFGLLTLALTVLFTADMLGLSPVSTEKRLEHRKQLSEKIALQLSSAVGYQNPAMMEKVLWGAVQQNDEIAFATIVRDDGQVLARIGGGVSAGSDLSQTLMRTPIYSEEQIFGRLELRFHTSEPMGMFAFLSSVSLNWVAFVLCFGVLGYWLMMRRSFRLLEPSSVVPGHVRNALDTLVEGVLILDNDERIVMANLAFERKVNLSSDELLGRKASDLGWTLPHSRLAAKELPWTEALRQGCAQEGAALGYCPDGCSEKVFVVNGAPINGEDGEGQGVLASFEDVTELESRNEEMRALLKELQISKRKLVQQNKQLHELATRDPLTECLNRRSFFEYLEAEFTGAQNSDGALCCVMVDIDHFKRVNDTHGHTVGDEVIKAVARILKGSIREEDHAGRYGGEEFCLLLPGMDLQQARLVAERCRERIASQTDVTFDITASFGLASISSGPASPEEMVDWADKALYVSKESGRNRVTVWDECAAAQQTPLQSAESERQRVERALDKALENGEFELFYQPQVNCKGQVIGAEALLRWNKPGEGFISPAQFIAIAEESGQILPIGEWVLNEACQQLSRWKAAAINPYFRRLAVNVSPLQFQHHQFVDRLHSILSTTGTNPAHLELELTENMLIDDVKGAVDKMKDLKELDISFSIDDFGTGYSSLLYLRHLPLNQLKIDQSFVRDLLTDANDAAIVNTIIAMASSLELKTIAEGVETQAEMEKLREMGCQSFQGYYLSRPVPRKEFENLLRNGHLLR